MTTSYEYRSFVDDIEFRSTNGKLTASGVAMRYGARSKVIDGKFREKFNPGAFARTINGGTDVRSHLEHFGPYLGRTGAGTLRLVDGRSEMGYELDLPDTSAGRDAAALLERRDIKGCSVAFPRASTKSTWSVDDDGIALRSVNEARLVYVDLTVAPAYDESTAELALRSFADDRGIELRSVLEAAERGEFAHLIVSPEDIEEEHRSDDDARLTSTVVRAPITSLYL